MKSQVLRMTSPTNTFRSVLDAQTEIPVDLDKLARTLGLSVVRKPMPDDISGEITRFGEDSYIIAINSTHPMTRQRFTLAHELGHYVLHRYLLGNGVTDNKAYRAVPGGPHSNPNITNGEETEANRFAASLLMPDPSVQRLKAAGLTPEQMAEKFQVSISTMRIRLGLKGKSKAAA